MAMTLPYDEWIAAKGELKALQRRVDMTNLRHLQPMLWRVHRTLAIDCAPKVAAAELKWVAEGMKAYPWLRKSAIDLANQIYAFPLAASAPHG